ncbi:MAG TPA: sugar transferase, partial [Acidimicrobiales bacterium]|nr:sugar transferase [Acidimicrobiales bacterium]
AYRAKATSRSRVLIVGSGSVAASLARRLSRGKDIRLVGYVDDDPYRTPRTLVAPYLGTLDDLPGLCAKAHVDRVLVAFSQSPPLRVAEVLRSLPANVRVSVVPRFFELVTWQSRVEDLHGLTVMDIAPPSLDVVSRAIKRGMDLAGSALLLLALSPGLVAIAVAIKVTSPGPVFFRQARIGYKGRTFKIFKFRTMEVGADDVKVDLRDRNEVDGPLFKLRYDPRVTRVGHFLRTTSLDELPQLFNVMLGDMSLVGPRPFVPDESALIDGWAVRRFDVRPGMTGLWQVSGRNDLPFEELRQLDYAYVASWSLWWDLKILWHTPGSVLRRHGAY